MVLPRHLRLRAETHRRTVPARRGSRDGLEEVRTVLSRAPVAGSSLSRSSQSQRGENPLRIDFRGAEAADAEASAIP